MVSVDSEGFKRISDKRQPIEPDPVGRDQRSTEQETGREREERDDQGSNCIGNLGSRRNHSRKLGETERGEHGAKIVEEEEKEGTTVGSEGETNKKVHRNREGDGTKDDERKIRNDDGKKIGDGVVTTRVAFSIKGGAIFEEPRDSSKGAQISEEHCEEDETDIFRSSKLIIRQLEEEEAQEKSHKDLTDDAHGGLNRGTHVAGPLTFEGFFELEAERSSIALVESDGVVIERCDTIADLLMGGSSHGRVGPG